MKLSAFHINLQICLGVYQVKGPQVEKILQIVEMRAETEAGMEVEIEVKNATLKQQI